ncbi:IS1182 family transposase [Deinococcus aquatilis]|uniref:IS1182 family transposase n=1 Tax=Deinococcus aquatilis TaxID=519440 RepID=UPI00037BB4D5|nr:IS1182 family transposase [Deinococcus aquatilis]
MSLHPQPIGEIPETTARIAQAAFRKGNTIMRLRDEFGALYTDADFAHLFPVRGQSALAPWRLALVTVFQFLENLTDRQAADQVRARIDWKYALGLELEDSGFDFSVLSEFRKRLIQGKADHLLLDNMLAHFKAQGLIKAKGKQRTDSTHVLAHVRALNHLELVAETLRAALNELATQAPDWTRGMAEPEWFERYGRRVFDFRLPKGQAARTAYATTVGNDGFQLLAALEAVDVPAGLREFPLVQTLNLVWTQHFERHNGQARLRDGPELPPGAERPISPYELEARGSTKRGTWWVGYKAHLTETCDDNEVHLITHVLTTPATGQDVSQTREIQQALIDGGLEPQQHLVDSGYVTAGLFAESHQRGITLIGPPRPNTSWQTKVEGAFDDRAFSIDWDAQQVTCPQGKRSSSWQDTPDRQDRPAVTVHFLVRDCQPCPVRAQCTRAKYGPRSLKLHPREAHEALRAAQSQGLGKVYAARAGIEGTIAQTTRSCGLRQARYRGLAKTHFQHVVTAVAVNAARVIAWRQGRPHAQTPTSRFAALRA